MHDNSIISVKLLTNQQRDGDSPVESIVTGLLGKSSKCTMDGSQSFESNGDLGISVWILQPDSSSAKKFD